jgi:hypothetical protein
VSEAAVQIEPLTKADVGPAVGLAVRHLQGTVTASEPASRRHKEHKYATFGAHSALRNTNRVQPCFNNHSIRPSRRTGASAHNQHRLRKNRANITGRGANVALLANFRTDLLRRSSN